jgi:phosphohistidine phosphatase
VVVSAARRTRQTWDLVAPELGGSPAVRFEPRAYAASALTLLYLAQELPSRYRTALFIAHNPGLSDLASNLAAPAITTDNGPRPQVSLPTAAVAVLEFSGDWPSLTPGQARLTDHIIPADL